MNTQCFECCSQSNIELHHVIPVSMGGTRTIPLCYSCHNKLHECGKSGVSTSQLVKRGHRRLKQRGYQIGQHPYGFKVVDKKLMRDPRESNMPSRGKSWHLTTVRRLLQSDHPCRAFIDPELIEAADSI